MSYIRHEIRVYLFPSKRYNHTLINWYLLDSRACHDIKHSLPQPSLTYSSNPIQVDVGFAVTFIESEIDMVGIKSDQRSSLKHTDVFTAMRFYIEIIAQCNVALGRRDMFPLYNFLPFAVTNTIFPYKIHLRRRYGIDCILFS